MPEARCAVGRPADHLRRPPGRAARRPVAARPGRAAARHRRPARGAVHRGRGALVSHALRPRQPLGRAVPAAARDRPGRRDARRCSPLGRGRGRTSTPPRRRARSCTRCAEPRPRTRRSTRCSCRRPTSAQSTQRRCGSGCCTTLGAGACRTSGSSGCRPISSGRWSGWPATVMPTATGS